MRSHLMLSTKLTSIEGVHDQIHYVQLSPYQNHKRNIPSQVCHLVLGVVHCQVRLVYFTPSISGWLYLPTPSDWLAHVRLMLHILPDITWTLTSPLIPHRYLPSVAVPLGGCLRELQKLHYLIYR